ncbi:uncharacterized protein LOC110463774 isoform X2 [Mizuhopecten yessoensis]|uniref:uncharacterized protein LOC110463774 isoform X2 n=1 Tax=Mizuhopecten yessoensis TaxID=6573 RepID=UPI000B4590B5|nr:uncharacterized protein LOC110463774 isoform X2 [Mizuhopecten yessoensis]
MCNKGDSILLLLVIWHLNTNADSQLIGEEKKYVFLEQAMLERVRPILLATTKALETRVGRLEEENKQILSELNSMKYGNPSPGPRFLMDPATLYSCFLSSDKLTLSNRRRGSTYDWPAVTDRKYIGVQGSSVITNLQTIYFETDIYYRIDQDLSSANLVFEVAFATEEAIGESYYVSRQKGAWSINAHNSDTQGVTLFFKSNGGNITHSEILSDATSGTDKYLKLGFFINRVDRTIAVFDINMNRKISTFTNVDESRELWPVFGVYRATETFVRLRLNTERDISSVPCGLF